MNRSSLFSSQKVIQNIIDGDNDGYVSDISLLNIDYVANKQVVEIREFLQFISDKFTILGAGNKVVNHAILLSNGDFEDNVQYVLAKEAGCEVIITNDKLFIKEDIEVYTSDEFVENFLKKQ